MDLQSRRCGCGAVFRLPSLMSREQRCLACMGKERERLCAGSERPTTQWIDFGPKADLSHLLKEIAAGRVLEPEGLTESMRRLVNGESQQSSEAVQTMRITGVDNSAGIITCDWVATTESQPIDANGKEVRGFISKAIAITGKVPTGVYAPGWFTESQMEYEREVHQSRWASVMQAEYEWHEVRLGHSHGGWLAEYIEMDGARVGRGLEVYERLYAEAESRYRESTITDRRRFHVETRGAWIERTGLDLRAYGAPA